MIYTRPFVTPQFIAFEGDSRISELYLAVIVIDAFTEEPPQAAIRVRLKEAPRTAVVRNKSGFFCFERVERPVPPKPGEPPFPGLYTLVIEHDRTTADWYYLESNGPVWKDIFEREINLPLANRRIPVTATLAPKSSYPFPANATLVRGAVEQGGARVPEAIVSTTYQRVPEGPPNAPPAPPGPLTVRTLTDVNGEFVLFFKRLATKTQPIKLTADKDGNQFQQPVPIMITEGTTLKNQILTLP